MREDPADDVAIRAARLLPRCALFAYAFDETGFRKFAVSSYFASGKFDKSSLHRWIAARATDDRLKTQNFRASVDNTVVFLPMDDDETTFEGHAFVVGYVDAGAAFVPVFVGVASGPVTDVPGYYCQRALPVHVLSTTCGKRFDFEDRCRSAVGVASGTNWTPGVRMLVSDLPDAAFEAERYDDVRDEYVRQRCLAAGFLNLVSAVKNECVTPIHQLERERADRLDLVMRHVVDKVDRVTQFPPTRRIVGARQTLVHVMKTYARHSETYGHLFEK